MIKILLKTFKYLIFLVLGLGAFVLMYVLAVLICTIIPVHQNFTAIPDRNIEVYIVTNGVHTDLLLPTDTSIALDRYLMINKSNTTPKYIAYGWGDKGFYLDTPTWADLKFSTAFKAATGLSSAAMHITQYPEAPVVNGKDVFKIMINQDQLSKLRQYVAKDFIMSDQHPQYIDCCWYYEDKRDAFYDSKGRYTLFKTCNVWTNGALKHAGIKTAVWAPFSQCVLYHLKN